MKWAAENPNVVDSTVEDSGGIVSADSNPIGRGIEVESVYDGRLAIVVEGYQLRDGVEHSCDVGPFAQEDPMACLLPVLTRPGAHASIADEEAPVPPSVVRAEDGFFSIRATVHAIGMNPCGKGCPGGCRRVLVNPEGNQDVLPVYVYGVSELARNARNRTRCESVSFSTRDVFYE